MARKLDAKRVVAVAVTGLVMAAGAAAWAQQEQLTPEQAMVAYRQSLMSSQGGHISAIARVVRGEVPFTDHVLAHAQGIAGTADLIPAAFPPGTGPDVVEDTRALPAIWENFEDFTARAQTLNTAAEALVAAAQTGDLAAITAAFGPVGQACGGCHDNYRAEEE